MHVVFRSSYMLAFLENQGEGDIQDTFSVPVLEVFPDIAIAYLQIVKIPMDLRTIKEERMIQYESIGELQQDLELMFQNCCKFNQAGSEIWFYTV
jgi:hypothetical protein